MNVRQSSNLLHQHGTVMRNIVGSHLEHVIEVARHHVAALHFGNKAHRLVEPVQGVLAGLFHRYQHYQDMTRTELLRVQVGAVAANDTGLLESAHSLGAGRLGEVHPARQLHDGEASMLL
ncbi:hypothetical protein Q427_19175 [Halomonas sp. BC04]|nr:hypothetical protein Q427_19175 [Halomonas sp. BC04]